jgi:hypothetical protein
MMKDVHRFRDVGKNLNDLVSLICASPFVVRLILPTSIQMSEYIVEIRWYIRAMILKNTRMA